MNNRNRKDRKKGFTLIELLAVIVVLAIIMIIAVPNVIGAMNKAKKKSFQMYGQRMLNSALDNYESDKLLSIGSDVDTEHHFSENGQSKPCYTLADMGYKNTGSYKGFVVIEPSHEVNGTVYRIFLTDNTYWYEGVNSDTVDKDTTEATIKPVSKAELANVKTKMEACR